MTEPVRLAGHGRRDDGALVTWTLAEGRKGRRWREAISQDGRLLHALLFETGPDGRFTHLELASPAGLATLHPEGDGTLHGNVVAADGVRHVIGLRYPADAAVVVARSPLASAALAWAIAGGLDIERVVELDPATLALTERPLEPDDRAAIDASGAPIGFADGAMWPLETDGRG
jgi:hypothetical protein